MPDWKTGKSSHAGVSQHEAGHPTPPLRTGLLISRLAAASSPVTPTAFGTDRAEALPDGSIALTCETRKSWTDRRSGTQIRAEHPGTAVRWGDEIFEVIEAIPLPLPAGGVRYRLAPWQDRHAIRVIESYDAPAETAREEIRTDAASGERRLVSSYLLSPILGHLPGEVQLRMEREFGAPAVFMTIVSALPFLVVGVVGALSHIASGFGAGALFPWVPPLLLSAFFVAESAIRIASAWLQRQPMGSVAGALIYAIVQAVRRQKSPGPAVASAGKPELAQRKKANATAHPSSPPPLPLSTLPTSTSALPADAAIRPPTGAEAERPDRFQMMEPLLSLLSESEQETLEQRFDFDVVKWGRITSAILFLVGASNAFASVAMMVGGAAGVTDILWLFAGIALAAEQVIRWRAASAGKPRGSVLGVAVRPFARPLLAPPADGSGAAP